METEQAHHRPLGLFTRPSSARMAHPVQHRPGQTVWPCLIACLGCKVLFNGMLVLPAGHDNAVIPQRARRALESEVQICAGHDLYIHRLHSHRCQPLPAPAPSVWPPHDGAVQRESSGRAGPACVRHCRLSLPADADRREEPINPGTHCSLISACKVAEHGAHACHSKLVWQAEQRCRRLSHTQS